MKKSAAWALAAMCLWAAAEGSTFGQSGAATGEPEAVRLIGVLQSDATVFDKAKACQRLALVGNREAVPVLASVLDDQTLSNYARYALEAIPDPAVDEALRAAMGRLEGDRLVGVISSIGRRRDVAAVAALGRLLGSDQPAVAGAAIKALGYIGNTQAAGILQAALACSDGDRRSAVGNACLLCAQRLEKAERPEAAIALYDAVRQADVAEHVARAATLRAILARGNEGIALLAEQIDSDDPARFRMALQAARGMRCDITDVLVARFDRRSPGDQVLLLLTLADVGTEKALPTVLKAARSSSRPVRVEAIRLLAQLGDASVVPQLLEAALDADQSVAAAACSTLAALQEERIDAEVTKLLRSDDAQRRQLGIALAGRRRIAAAAPELFRLADVTDPAVRAAAIMALGETVGQEAFSRLLARVRSTGPAEEQSAARQAIRIASARMPERNVCARQLAAAMAGTPADVQIFLIEQLAAVGGAEALAAVAAAARSEDDAIQDAATRVLGTWMTADAAPDLRALATTLSSQKYRIRALRGYLRIARQLDVTPAQGVQICRDALSIADRDAEKSLALDTLGRLATREALDAVVGYLNDASLKQRAAATALAVGERLVQSHPAEVQTAMQRVMSLASDPSFKERARSLSVQAERRLAEVRDEEGFRSIFDGKTMEGWEGNRDVFRIEGGAIVAGTLTQRIGRNEFLCTKEGYGDFELRLQFKLLGAKPNAGVQIRSRRIPDHHEVAGYQADLGPGWWGCLYDESRRRRVLAGPEPAKRSQPVRVNEWNDYRIRCQGNRIQLWINGTQTVDYTEQDPDIEQTGIIGLQVHAGEPMEAWYRHIRIKEL